MLKNDYTIEDLIETSTEIEIVDTNSKQSYTELDLIETEVTIEMSNQDYTDDNLISLDVALIDVLEEVVSKGAYHISKYGGNELLFFPRDITKTKTVFVVIGDKAVMHFNKNQLKGFFDSQTFKKNKHLFTEKVKFKEYFLN